MRLATSEKMVFERTVETIARRENQRLIHNNRFVLGEGLKTQKLVRLFIGKPTILSFRKDLDKTVSAYGSLVGMCPVSKKDKLKTIPVLLSGDALF